MASFVNGAYMGGGASFTQTNLNAINSDTIDKLAVTGSYTSSSASSGALTVTGGVGIGGALYCTGMVHATSTNQSTSSSTGSLVSSGGLGVAKDAYITGNANAKSITCTQDASTGFAGKFTSTDAGYTDAIIQTDSTVTGNGFKLMDLKAGGSSVFSVDGSGAAVAKNLTTSDSDTTSGVVNHIQADYATFTGTVLEASSACINGSSYYLLDLQKNGSSVFKVRGDGVVTAGSTVTSTGNINATYNLSGATLSLLSTAGGNTTTITASNTNASFTGNLIWLDTPGVSPSTAYNLIKAGANSVDQFVVNGQGDVTANGDLTAGSISTAGLMRVTNTTATTSFTDGAFHCAGGGSFSGGLNVQGNSTYNSNLTTNGQLSTTQTTDASSTSTGALVSAGGLGVGKKIYAGDDVHIPTTFAFIANATKYGESAIRYSAGPFSVVKDGTGNGVQLADDGTSWAATSDLRAKKNIKPLDHGLDKVLAMKPVRFNYTNDLADDSRRLGFVAQEMKPVVGEVVHGDEKEGLLTLSSTDLVPVLVKAIQELYQMVAQLRGEDPSVASAASVPMPRKSRKRKAPQGLSENESSAVQRQRTDVPN